MPRVEVMTDVDNAQVNQLAADARAEGATSVTIADQGNGKSTITTTWPDPPASKTAVAASAGGATVTTIPSTTAAAALAAGSNPVSSNTILADYQGNGASAATAAQDHLPPGHDASRTMARTDLVRVTALKDHFNVAAVLTGLPPALLAAIASRESRCGSVLTSEGMGDGGNAFGIMQVDLRFHNPIAGRPDPTSQAHINQASGILKDALTAMIAKFPTMPAVRQLQAAVAAYNCGAGAVGTPDTADNGTTGHDYSNDVWERARFYSVGW